MITKINNCWVLKSVKNGSIVYQYNIKEYFFTKYIRPYLVKIVLFYYKITRQEVPMQRYILVDTPNSRNYLTYIKA
jgi:hypothetical protein